MEPNFWHRRWAENQIGFHNNEANPLLLDHVGALKLAPDARVFVPLCGKTLDIAWLLSKGYRVVGVELSELAITQLFAELKVSPEVTALGSLTHYAIEGLDIYVGDFFDLTAEILGPVDAVYDRAALVALPQDMRPRYAAHLAAATQAAPQLVVCYVYDQSKTHGPPFAVPDDEIIHHYHKHYALNRLATIAVPGGLRGSCPATETVWHLTPLNG